jgi:hypothetical protein
MSAHRSNVLSMESFVALSSAATTRPVAATPVPTVPTGLVVISLPVAVAQYTGFALHWALSESMP